MSELKDRLRADLTAAMKASDELTRATLRMALAAISTAEVAGESARELDDDEVIRVLSREARKRAESAEAFESAGRDELAARERAEGKVLAGYLPSPLTDAELAALARRAVEEVTAANGGPPGQRQMGQVMKAATAASGGRAGDGRLAAAVKALLAPS